MISRDQIEQLSPGEKIALLDDVWDSLAQSMRTLGPSDEEKRLLDERNREIEGNPAATISFEEFKHRLGETR